MKNKKAKAIFTLTSWDEKTTFNIFVLFSVSAARYWEKSHIAIFFCNIYCVMTFFLNKIKITK